MTYLHNLLTGSTSEIGPEHLQPISEHQLLVLPNQSLSVLQNLQASWTSQFPGDSAALAALRSNTIAAHWDHLQARAAFEQVKLELSTLGLPMHHWEPSVLARYQFMQKLHLQSERHFQKSLTLLQSAHAAAQTPARKAPIPPPENPQPKPNPGYLAQTVRVSVVDGQTISDIDFPPAHFCRRNDFQNACAYWRQFHFRDAIIPPEYEYVLSHDGLTYPPAENFSILYLPDEFERLSRLELLLNSPHLLDGERQGFLREPD